MKKKLLALTPKQIAAIESALRSTSQLRSHRESAYLLRTLKTIREQTL